MGFFDPPHIKIVEHSPPHFRDLADLAMTIVEADHWPHIKGQVNRENFATAVLASLALASNRQEGSWSSRSIRSIEAWGDVAVSHLSRPLIDAVRSVADEVWGNFRILLQPKTELKD